MGKLIVWNLISLDGYFEGAEPWSLDWHQTAWGPDMDAFSIEQAGDAERLIFGRKTYEGMAAAWENGGDNAGAAEPDDVTSMMNRLPKVVFSKTLPEATWVNTTLIGDDAPAEVAKLKQQGDGDSFIFGSAELMASLIPHGLIDEYRIGIAPVVLGAGRPLFDAALGRIPMRLVEARSMESDCVILRYVAA